MSGTKVISTLSPPTIQSPDEANSISANWHNHKFTLIGAGSVAAFAFYTSIEAGLFTNPTGWAVVAALTAFTALTYFVFLLFGSTRDVEHDDSSFASSNPDLQSRQPFVRKGQNISVQNEAAGQINSTPSEAASPNPSSWATQTPMRKSPHQNALRQKLLSPLQQLLNTPVTERCRSSSDPDSQKKRKTPLDAIRKLNEAAGIHVQVAHITDQDSSKLTADLMSLISPSKGIHRRDTNTLIASPLATPLPDITPIKTERVLKFAVAATASPRAESLSTPSEEENEFISRSPLRTPWATPLPAHDQTIIAAHQSAVTIYSKQVEEGDIIHVGKVMLRTAKNRSVINISHLLNHAKAVSQNPEQNRRTVFAVALTVYTLLATVGFYGLSYLESSKKNNHNSFDFVG